MASNFQVKLSWKEPGMPKLREPILSLPVALGREFEQMPAKLQERRVSRMVLKDAQVSCYHALIDLEENYLVITNQSSNNHILVNGKSKKRCILADGDILDIGSYKITVTLNPSTPLHYPSNHSSLPIITTQPVISVHHLNHYFGSGELRKQALFDINLDIYPSEIIIMTGPSGSGKTTLLTLMGGLRSAQQGSLKILGQEMCRANKNQLRSIRCQIGYIFQAHNLMTFLTAKENVRMSMELHQEFLDQDMDAKAVAMLESVGLGNRADYYPENMSGGQKQRVAIARALVSKPKIILADEPTAALDKKSGRDVVELMQKLAKEQNCTILLVTHDNRILDIADRIVYMEDGRLVDDGIDAAAKVR